jgi:hypothetical protein
MGPAPSRDMRVFTTLFLGIILAAGPAVVTSMAHGQAGGETPTGKTTKNKKAKHNKTKKPKKEANK